MSSCGSGGGCEETSQHELGKGLHKRDQREFDMSITCPGDYSKRSLFFFGFVYNLEFDLFALIYKASFFPPLPSFNF